MEKQYKPSKKRLENARKEGNVSKSQYLSQSCGLLTGLLVALYYIGNSWVEHKLLVEYMWTEGFKSPERVIGVIASKYLILTLKLLLIVSTVNLGIETLQTGLHLEPGLLGFKLERINPISGIKKIFGNVKNSWQVVLKFTVIAFTLSWFFNGILAEMGTLFFVPSARASGILSGHIISMTEVLGSQLILFALLDYYIQKRKWFKNVGMTMQEMRQEHKDDEGDPHIKSLRKHRHRELLQQDLVKRIRAAKVIIVERAA
jgi:flagellar biosynthesis protein FlhB